MPARALKTKFGALCLIAANGNDVLNDFENQSWRRKFQNAFRGIWICVSSQNSFYLHIPFAILVIAFALYFRVSPIEGMILAICITAVFAFELVNTAIEYLAKEVTREESSMVKNSLDAAAGAVLVASIGSAIIGAWIFLPKIFELLNQSN